MKTLFRLLPAHVDGQEPLYEFTERIPENIDVLLQGHPFTQTCDVFVRVGSLAKSEDLAAQIGQYVHGRRWGRITRNDGHYLEVEVDIPTPVEKAKQDAPNNKTS